MVRYMSLLRFTDQGIKAVAESGRRAAEFRRWVEEAGGKILLQDWAVGDFDGCVAFEMPSEELAARLLVRLGRAGNVRTHSLRLFDEAAFKKACSEA